MTTPEPSVAGGVQPRSRRAVLAAAGGAAAAVLAAMARPAHSEAAAGSPIILGSQVNNAGTSDTQVIANSGFVTFKLLQNGPGTGLMGYATALGGGTRGVYGRVDSPDGDGIQARNAGTAGTGAAVRAFGGQNPAVIATTDALGPAVRGLSGGGTVEQIHPGGEFAEAAAEFAGPTGIIGASTIDANGVVGLTGSGGTGVYGRSPSGGTGVRGQTGSGFGVLAQALTGIGVYAQASSGSAVYAISTSGYAGYFDAKVFFNSYLDIDEISAPSAPAANQARLFVQDNGAGKTQLCVLYSSGAIQVLNTQP